MELARIRKRLLCVLLALSIVVTAEYTAYKEVPEVKAVVVEYVSYAMVLAILAACGYTFVHTSSISQGLLDGDGDYVSWWTAAAQAEETLSTLYDNTVLAFKNGLIDPTFQVDPDSDDPNNNYFTWDELKEWIVNNGGKVAITVGGVLASVLLHFRYEIYVRNALFANLPDTWTTDQWPLNEMLDYVDEYPYYLVIPASDEYRSSCAFFMFDSNPCLYLWRTGSSKNIHINCFYYKGYDYVEYIYGYKNSSSFELALMDDGTYNGVVVAELSTFYPTVSILGTNIGAIIKAYDGDAMVDTPSDVDDYDDDQNHLNPDAVTPSSGLQDSIDKNGDTDSYPVATSVVLPTDDQVTDYAQSIADAIEAEDDPDADPDADLVQDAVDDFVDDITTPGLDESDPDDDDDVSNVDTDDETVQAKLSLFLLPEWITKRFPFCIPFDLVESFSALDSETRTAPYYELPLKAENYGIDEVLVIDLSEYDEVAELLRTLELLLFIVGLILATRSLIRG